MKKVGLFLLVLILVGGGAFYFFQQKNGENENDVKVGEGWNHYATDDHHLVTLNDRMATVAGGGHIAKFTLTLEFKDEDGYEKFMGHGKPLTEKEKNAEESSHGSEDEGHVTPMNVKINSIVSDFMMNLGTQEAKNVQYIEENLKNYLNEKLGLEKDFIEAVYLEQYVFN